jgi:hypothetical protein
MTAEQNEIVPGGFRYSLRKLLLMVTVAAIGCGFLNAVRPFFGKGHISDLPVVERQILDSIGCLGISVCDAFK